MEDNKVLKFIYALFLGILLAIFVGVGINTFYPAPPAPAYPEILSYPAKEVPAEGQDIEQQRKYEMEARQHTEALKPYNRNVSILTMAAAVVFLAISLLFEKRMKIIADGVLLGGLFTLLYSIARGFASENSKYVFVMVSISLVIALYLGYHRFIRQQQKPAKKQHKR